MSSQALERGGWWLALLASVSLAVAAPGTLPGPIAAIALPLVLAIVPGAWLARVLAPGAPRDARAALALLLSPFVSGVLLLLPRLAGLAAAPSARAFAGASALLSAWEALRPRERDESDENERGAWGPALLVGGVVLLAHALSPALSARSDGSFHAGVVWAAARAVPPEDPFFAGLPLRYFWGLHVWAAAWVALAPRLGAYAPLMVTSALAAVSALLAVGALARRLGAAPRAQWLAQALALVGATPFAWLVLAARAASGEVRGGAEFARALGHGADTALRALDPGLLHPSLILPLDKFVVLTPFAWGLAGAAVLALALLEAVESAGWRVTVAIGLVFAALLFVHPVAGLALGAAAIVGVGLLALMRLGPVRTLGAIVLALACALLALSPYLRAVTGGDSSGGLGLRLALDPRGVLSVLVAGACVLPWAAWELARIGARDPGRILLGGMLVALVGATCVLHFSGDNQSKFLNLALLLAAAPAAVTWSRIASTPGPRATATALLATALAPTLAVVVWAYAHESDTSADAPSLPPRAIVEGVRRFATMNAVVLDATADTTRGAAPGLPGETGCKLTWSGGFMGRKWGYAADALHWREVAARSLARGQWPGRSEGESLPGLDRPVWVITREDSVRAPDLRWKVVARADGVVLGHFARN